MPEGRRSSHLAVGYGGNPPSGFYDADERAPSAQITGANGNKPSRTQNRVHYVTALPGVGKTHLSVALAEAAIQAGFGAYFMTAHDLVNDLGSTSSPGISNIAIRCVPPGGWVNASDYRGAIRF